MGRVATSIVAALWCLAGAVPHAVFQAGAGDAPVTIRTARLFDGHGRMLADRVVAIDGSRIVAVGDRPGPVTYDLGDVTLLPGFIDVHTHIDWYFQPGGRFGWRDGDPPEPAGYRHTAIRQNLEATLHAGFTTIQNVGSPGDAQWRTAVASGLVAGPRILTSLGQVTGVGDGRPLSPDALRAEVRALHADGADLVKVVASAGVRAMSQAQLDAVCGEARTLGLRTLVHAFEAGEMRRAVRAGCGQIEHGAFTDDQVLKEARDRGVYLDPNIGLVLQNYLEHRDRFIGWGGLSTESFLVIARTLADGERNFRRVVRSGVRMPLGSDAVAGAHGQNAREIIARVAHGQPARDALIGATSLAAESLGLGAVIGTIAPGFEADLVAVRGNPLDDITRTRDVVFVMKGGRVYRSEEQGTERLAGR